MSCRIPPPLLPALFVSFIKDSSVFRGGFEQPTDPRHLSPVTHAIHKYDNLCTSLLCFCHLLFMFESVVQAAAPTAQCADDFTRWSSSPTYRLHLLYPHSVTHSHLTCSDHLDTRQSPPTTIKFIHLPPLQRGFTPTTMQLCSLITVLNTGVIALKMDWGHFSLWPMTRSAEVATTSTHFKPRAVLTLDALELQSGNGNNTVNRNHF